ncbi:MAG: NAD(P)/FAD-dependent oxidoreductase [Candidatus Heimdallarchaeota archaeon]|nr:NAD(P)/FAD-dependent oxidoreductase [Candidatus Heimdallarchaeota archaeon]MDH5646306.1 NAD(P)/FAD-dependent oxidoreductase [Candidatus Heimdallarchaeota archaeon]
MNVDVAIVGGGPAGCIAAITIARAGYSCVIVDKKIKQEIGNKNCGDALDGKHIDILLREMNIEPPSLENGEARDEIKRINIAIESLEHKITAPVPGFQVDRLVYGQRLLNIAESEGTSIITEANVRDIILEENQIRGFRYYHQGEKKEIRAHITIDASGFIGVIRKQIPEALCNGIDYSIKKEDSIATYREIVKFNENKNHNFENQISIIYTDRIPKPGYAWIFSEGKGKLNLGITWQKSLEYPDNKSMKQLYHECLDPYYPPNSYEILDSGGGNIPMRPNFDSLVVNGAMITGDAGSLADPTTFEGHGPALESGRLAGLTAISALKKGSYLVENLWDYNVNIMKYPGAMHTQSFLTRKLLERVKNKDIIFLLNRKLITTQDLIDIFEFGKEITFKQKIVKVLKTFPRWDLIYQLKKTISLIEATVDVYNQYPTTPSGLQSWRELRNKKLNLNY